MSEAFDHHRGQLPLLQPTSLRRMLILLGVNWLGFGLVNAFWLYLSSGHWLDLRPSAYAADFVSPVPLAEMFEHPLNVLSHPWMIVVGGLLLGIIIFVPIIVAVLYRLPFAGAFVLLVWALGHAPVLAMALAAACVLAGRTKLRSDVPFLGALLGMVPVVLYLYFFANAGTASMAVQPIQRWALKAPLVLAAVSAVAAFIAVLALARLTHYRPGVIWPVMALLLAGPVTTFYVKIGSGELNYQLIANRLAAGDAVFEPVALKHWVAAAGAKGLSQQALLTRAIDDLGERKRLLQDRCRHFLHRYPASPRAAAVMWIDAQCQCLQLDRPAFEQGWIKSTAAYSAPLNETETLAPPRRAELTQEAIGAAQAAWTPLVAQFADSQQAALAQWRLGELQLMKVALPQGGPDDARALVDDAYKRLTAAGLKMQAVLAELDERGKTLKTPKVFSDPPSVPPHEYYEQSLFKVRRLLWLMDQDSLLTDANAARALSAYLQVNRFAQEPNAHRDQLAALAGQYKDTRFGTQLAVACALALGDPNRRADELVILAMQKQDSQAAIEASFELGQLVLQQPSLGQRPDIKTPQAYFQAVTSGPWKDLALERLRVLAAMTTQPATPKP